MKPAWMTAEEFAAAEAVRVRLVRLIHSIRYGGQTAEADAHPRRDTLYRLAGCRFKDQT